MPTAIFWSNEYSRELKKSIYSTYICPRREEIYFPRFNSDIRTGPNLPAPTCTSAPSFANPTISFLRREKNGIHFWVGLSSVLAVARQIGYRELEFISMF